MAFVLLGVHTIMHYIFYIYKYLITLLVSPFTIYVKSYVLKDSSHLNKIQSWLRIKYDIRERYPEMICLLFMFCITQKQNGSILQIVFSVNSLVICLSVHFQRGYCLGN